MREEEEREDGREKGEEASGKRKNCSCLWRLLSVSTPPSACAPPLAMEASLSVTHEDQISANFIQLKTSKQTNLRCSGLEYLPPYPLPKSLPSRQISSVPQGCSVTRHQKGPQRAVAPPEHILQSPHF